MRLYGIGDETATTILAFILDYFQKKLLARTWVLFAQIWSKMNFCGKRVLNIPIIYHHVKNQKILMGLRKMLELMDGQADRQQWFYSH